jgi:hypothetical protein
MQILPEVGTVRDVGCPCNRLYFVTDSNIAGLLDQWGLIRHQSAENCGAQEKDASDVTHGGASMRHFCALGVAPANQEHSQSGIIVVKEDCGAADELHPTGHREVFGRSRPLA